MTTESADLAAPEPADAIPDSEPEPELEPEPAAAASRRRGRTALIMAVAVVLGVLGGAGIGYAVQYDRAPTPLPPLSVSQPQYPSVHVSAPPLSAAEDDMAKTDGDLTALLVPAPAGAKPFTNETQIDQWMTLGDFAETFTNPAGGYSWQANHNFRRAASARWLVGPNGSVVVHLIQYSHAKESMAATQVNNQERYAPDTTGSSSVPVPHSANGMVFAGRKANSDGGSTYYEGRGYADHGDIAVEVYIQSDSPVSAQSLLTLVQSQLERL